MNNTSKGFLARNFPHLEVLELGFNKIVSIASLNLKGLNELRVLTLESNEIMKVDGLYGLPNLQQLVLAKNKIKRFEVGTSNQGPAGSGGQGGRSSFAGLNELRGLQLEENGLRSLVGLGSLPKLRALFLAYNRLSELNELEYLSPDRCSPVLQEVTLRNNPLARKHLYRATLIRRVPTTLTMIDGREVTPEEREKADQIFANSSGGSSIGPNGEPLIGATGGMPGGIYFYADNSRQQEKVPLKMQSFTLAGFAETLPNTQAGGGGYHHPSSSAPVAPSGYGGGGGGQGLGLGIGGVSLQAQHGIAHMNLNMGANMGIGPRSSFSGSNSSAMMQQQQQSPITQQFQQLGLGGSSYGVPNKILSQGGQGQKKPATSIKGRK